MSDFIANRGKIEEQEGEVVYDNGTLQGNPKGVELNVAAFFLLPDEQLASPHNLDDVILLVKKTTKEITKRFPLVEFQVDIRHGEDVDPDELVPW